MHQNDLTEVLHSLVQEDGKPDPIARRKQLDNLVLTLSNHEIRRLRKQLNNVTMQMDICSALPLEILLAVSSYLDLEDLFKLRSVSRSWYSNFTSPDFCLGIIEKHFPSAWLRFTEQPKTHSAGEIIAKEALLEWFQGAAMAQLRRQHGRYQSTSVYYYNYITSRPEDEQFEKQYSNGRVAFRTSQSGILTRNLRTGHTSQFLQKDRESIHKWALLDQNLIVSTVSPNTVLAWSLETSRQTCSISLPNRPVKVSGRGDTVAIVTSIGEILLWKIGGSLKLIDTAHFKFTPTSTTASVLFPQDGHSFFIACQNDSIKWDSCLFLQEYNITGERLAAYHPSLSQPYFFRNMATPVLRGRKIIWRLNPYFEYTLTLEDDFQDSACLPPAPQYSNSKHDLHHSTSILLATFDIYTKKVAFQTYHLPSPKLGLGDAFFWDYQAILVVLEQLETHPKGQNDMVLLAINSCDISKTRPEQTPRYGTKGMNDKTIVFDPQEDSLSNVAWSWIQEDDFTTAKFGYDDPYVNICGDENFVVVFGKKYGMMVWSFEKDVKLPVSWSRFDPDMADALKSHHPLDHS